MHWVLRDTDVYIGYSEILVYALGTQRYRCMHWVLRDTDVYIRYSEILVYASGTEGYGQQQAGVFGVT